jgi:hypothetical protein
MVTVSDPRRAALRHRLTAAPAYAAEPGAVCGPGLAVGPLGLSAGDLRPYPDVVPDDGLNVLAAMR